MKFSPKNLPRTEEERAQFREEVSKLSVTEQLDFALGVLGDVGAIMDKAFPGYVPEMSDAELAQLSTDEKIALGERNIAELKKMAKNAREMLHIERLDKAAPSAEAKAASDHLLANISRAGGAQ